MFLRLIGEEGAALSSTAANPFADTPAWCDRYVAYAYEKGLYQGQQRQCRWTALLWTGCTALGRGVHDLSSAGAGLLGQRGVA